MASALNELVSFQKEFTCCGICFDVYHQPKMLACLHTFCFQCLVDYVTKSNDQEVCCPVCRGSIPKTLEELHALPTNFFINRLLEMKLLAVDGCTPSEAVYCDPCSTHRDEIDLMAGCRPRAVVYCVECKEKLCQDCVVAHRKVRMVKVHQLIEFGPDYAEKLQSALKNSPVNCETHDDERLGFYCLNCSQAICMKCCVLQHKDHTYLDISEAAKRFKSGLDRIVETTTVNISKCNEIKENSRRQKQKLLDKTKGLQVILENRVMLLQEEIEKQKNLVLQGLSDYNSDKTTEIDQLDNEVDKKLETLESFRQFCQELKEKGTNFDIAKLSNQFISRSRELENAADEVDKNIDVSFTFKPGTTEKNIDAKTCELFGCLTSKANPPPPPAASQTKDSELKIPSQPGMSPNVNNPKTPSPMSTQPEKINQPIVSLSAVLPGTKPIQGVVLMSDKLYVVRIATSVVEVYDVTGNEIKLTSQYQITGLANPTDMMGDEDNLTIFIGDWISCSVYRMAVVLGKGGPVGLKLDGKFLTSDCRPNSLSLSITKTILVCGTTERQILEYSPGGELLRQLQTLAFSPRHIIEITQGQYAVVCGDDQSPCVLARMSVTADNKVHFHRQFGGEKAPMFCRLNDARHVLMCRPYCLLFLADCKHDRVLALNPETMRTVGKELIGNKQLAGLNPNRVCLSANGSDLYVGCLNGSLLKFFVEMHEVDEQPFKAGEGAIPKPKFYPQKAGDGAIPKQKFNPNKRGQPGQPGPPGQPGGHGQTGQSGGPGHLGGPGQPRANRAKSANQAHKQSAAHFNLAS